MHEELDVGPGELPGYQFRTTLNGYDRKEVDTLLHAVAANWERQRRAHEAELAAARGERPAAGEVGSVGDGVEAILERAREVGDEIVEQARAERESAATIVAEAQARATEILAEAKEEAKLARREAEEEYEDLLERAATLREELQHVLSEAGALAERLPARTEVRTPGGSEPPAPREIPEAEAGAPEARDPQPPPESTTEPTTEPTTEAPHSSGLRRLLHHS